MACKFTYKGNTYSREEILDKIQNDNIYVEGNYSEEKQWLEDKLGLTENKDFELIKGLIESGSFGKFMEDGKILLSENFEQGTAYHEAFHRVYNMYLTKEQRQILIQEFDTRKDKDTIFKQFKAKYPSLSKNDIIEEILAEEFRDYVLSNGTYKFAEKEKSGFFASLFKLLKTLYDKLTGGVVTQEELYSKINKGDFKSNVNTSYEGLVKDRAITYTVNGEKVRISELNTQRLMRGTIYLLLDKLKQNNLTFTDIADKNINLNDLIIGNVYGNSIIKDLISKIGNKLSKDNPGLSPVEFNKIFNNDPIIKLLLNIYTTKNTVLFQKYLDNYLKAFKINITNVKDLTDEELEEISDFTNEVLKESKEGDTKFSKATIEYDPYSSISDNIKLTLATIPRQDINGNKLENELGLNEMEDPQFIFMLLSQTLAGVPADPYEFINKLQSISSKFPYIKDIMERTGLTSSNIETLGINDINKRNEINKFIQAFAKTRFFYNLTMIDGDSNAIYSLDAEIDNANRKIREQWQSNFNTQAREIASNIKAELSKYKATDYKKFAKDILKLDLTDSQLNNNSIEKELKYILVNMDKLINPKSEFQINASIAKGILNEDKTVNIKTLSNFINGKKTPYDVSGSFENIAKEIAFENEFVNLQHYNSEGKLVYGISLNTHFSKITDKINYILSDDSIPNDEKQLILEIEFPHLFTPYSENSLLREYVINGKKINIGISDGVKDKNDSSGTPTDKLKGPMRLSQVLNDTLSGIYHFMQTGDRSTMNIFTVNDENGRKLFYKGGKKADGSLDDNTMKIFINYLKDEVNTYKELKANPSDYEHTNKNNELYKLRFFKDTFTESEITALVNATNLDSELEKPIYKQKINKYLQTKVEAYKKLLAKNEVLTIVNGKTPGISSEYFNSTIFDTNDKVPTIDDLVRISYINQVIANIEQTKLYFGDFAALKNATEVFKRLSQWNSTKKVSINSKMNNDFIRELNNKLLFKLSDGTEINYNDSKNNITAGDPVITESVLKDADFSLTDDDLKQLKDIAKASFSKDVNETTADKLTEKFTKHYTKAEEGDGASYVNMYFYRELLLKSGSWDSNDQLVFEKIIKNEELSADEIIRMTMLKPNYLGPVESNIFQTGVRKTSYFPLIPQLIRGTNLEALHEAMLKKGIDVIHLSGASKFGAKGNKGTLLPFYNNDGSINIDNWVPNTLSWDYMGIQLDMNKQAKGSITEASQARKNLLHNLFEYGVPRDPELALLAQEYAEKNQRNIEISFEKVIDEIGLEKQGNRYKINNWSKLKNILIQEAIDRGSTDNILVSIDKFIVSENNVKFINTLSNKEKVEQIIMSYVTNNIIRQKRYGDALPQGSIKGFEKLGEHRDKNDKTFYSSDILKFRDNKGRTEFAVPLPMELYKYVNKLEGTLKKPLTTFEEKLEYFNNNLSSEMSESLREFHGVRIPNQAYASNTPGIIVKYLHPTANTIIVPTAFVTQTGSDFDIDKLFTYFKKFKIFDNKITNIKYISNFEELKAEAKELKEYLDANSRETEEEAKMANVYKKDFKEKVNRYNQIKRILNESGGSEKDSLNNDLIDIAMRLMLHPANARQLYNAVDDSVLKEDLVEDMLQVMTGSKVTPENKLTISDIFDPMTSHTKFKDFFAGSAGVGQTARHIPNHAFTQLKNLTITPENSIMFNDNGGRLGGIKDVNGNWITETLSMFLTGSVDIGKFPYLRYLGINTRTLPIAVYLVRRGVSYREVMMFLKQPAIQKFLEFSEINESEFAKSTKRGTLDKDGNLTGGLNLSNANVVARTFQWLGADAKVLNKSISDGRVNPNGLLENILNEFSLNKQNHTEAELKKGLSLYNGDLELDNKLNMTNEQRNNQLKMLAEFLVYTEHSKIFEKYVGIANPDTTAHKDLQEVIDFNDAIDEVRQSGFFYDFDNVWFSKDILSGFYNAINIKSSYNVIDYTLNNPQVSNYLNNMSTLIAGQKKDKEAKKKLKKTIFTDFVLRQIFRYLESKNLNKKNLMVGVNTVSKKIQNIQTNPKHPLHENLFIKSLLPLVEGTNLNGELFDNVLLYKKKMNSDEINLLTDEFSQIRVEDPELYRNIIILNFLQAGLMNHPYQLNQILPAEDYQILVNNALTEAVIDKNEMDTFFEKFVLTRPNLLEKVDEDAFYTPNIYSLYDPQTKQYTVKFNNEFHKPRGNGFNILNYFGKKETDFSFNIEAITELNNNNKTSAPIINTKTEQNNFQAAFTGYISQNMFGKNDVMVFGANKAGFHGQGVAALAYANTVENYKKWNPNLDKDVKENKIGDFAIAGKTGLMQGNKGTGYGLVTVERPGKPLNYVELGNNIEELYNVARENPDKNFIIPYNSDENLNKLSLTELANAFGGRLIPSNVFFGDKMLKEIIRVKGKKVFENNKEDNDELPFDKPCKQE